MTEFQEQQMEFLEQQMGSLQIQSAVRKSNRFDLPDILLVNDFDLLAADIAGMPRSSTALVSTRNKYMIEFFGVPPIVMAKAWELIVENNEALRQGAKKKHLLWALHYLKAYPSNKVMCKTMKLRDDKNIPDRKTLSKWVGYFIEEVCELEHIVIVWENRLTNDRGNDCMISVDCTDCPFQQVLIPDPTRPGGKIRNKALYSKKLNGPALRYELGLSILSNDIVWIHGPFPPGDWNDLQIFRHCLIHELEEGERVEADDIYAAEHRYCVCPNSATSTEEGDRWRRRIQGRHEALNKHIKNWTCLVKPFTAKGSKQEKIAKHNQMFRACTILKQIAMEMGVGELYDVGDEYGN